MLAQSEKEFTSLGQRATFNRTLRHLVSVTTIVDRVEKGENLADILNELLDSEMLARDQIGPVLSLVLVSKMDLPFRSRNLPESVNKFEGILAQMKKWPGVDLVIAYHHPNLGIIPINPANEAHWNNAIELKRDELVVVYARAASKKTETAQKALDAFFTLLKGGTPAEDPDFATKPVAAKPVAQRAAAAPAAAAQARPMPGAPGAMPQPRPMPAAPGAAQPQAPAPAPQEVAPKEAPKPAAAAAPAGARNLTPKYSVQVTNELFHNGNVEAWKNIIESYEGSHPGCKVIVYHEGELIQDLNSLFKWGKVKHGGLLMFQVAGNAIKNVSRLQKYLHEGASKRYETFMKHDMNRNLSLF